MKILNTKRFFPSDLEYMKKRLGDGFIFLNPDNSSEDVLLENAPKADVFLGAFVSDELMQKALDLKLIQIPWTGVDNLNYKVLKKYDVPVCNSHSNSGAVAEHAFSLLFSLIKKIPYHDRMLRKGKWNRPVKGAVPEYDNFSDTVHDKNILFLGYGHIAQQITHYLKPFGCSISAVDPLYKNSRELDKCVDPKDIYSVVPDADIIFVTLPYLPETDDLVNAELLSKFKPGSYLINVSRGKIVNEQALFNSLNEKQIAGAAVDVWYNYPKGEDITFPSSKYPFHELDNIVMSPHRAGFIKDELPHLEDAVENIKRLFEGRELINKIDLEKKY